MEPGLSNNGVWTPRILKGVIDARFKKLYAFEAVVLAAHWRVTTENPRWKVDDVTGGNNDQDTFAQGLGCICPGSLFFLSNPVSLSLSDALLTFRAGLPP